MPVATDAIAPHVCVSAETGSFKTPIARATSAIESADPCAIWPTKPRYSRTHVTLEEVVHEFCVFLIVHACVRSESGNVLTPSPLSWRNH